jgi:hypothetical protein
VVGSEDFGAAFFLPYLHIFAYSHSENLTATLWYMVRSIGMTMITRTSRCFWIGTLALVSLQAADGQDAPRSPELEVLDRFLGTWKIDMVSKPAEWTKQEVKLTGTTTNEWTLGGRFQIHRAKYSPTHVESVEMLTYDADRKVYRFWHFNSNGIANETTGAWDEKSKTMTFKGDFGNGITSVSKMRFVDKDTREAVMTAKDKSGKVYLDVHVKLVRQK